MGIFGDDQLGQVTPDNPLGLEQAPVENVENMEMPGQPAEIGVGLGEENAGVGEGQEIVETQPEEVIESVDVNDDFERKAAYIRQKFKGGPEELEKSINELRKKLGRENEEVNFETAEDVINYYIGLERELGRTSNIDQTRQENQRLQQEVEQLRNTINQFLLHRGNANWPMRDPATGRFVSPAPYQQQMHPQMYPQMQPQMPQQMPQQQEVQEEELKFDDLFKDINTDTFLREFYEKGPQAEDFQKLIINAAERIADHKLNQFVKKQQEEQQQKMLERQQKEMQARYQYTLLKNKADNIKMKYGEQEIEKYKDGMTRFLEKYPYYLDPILYPNGLEVAFLEARRETMGYQEQQHIQQEQQQYNTAQKFAARIPRSTTPQRVSREYTPEEREKMMLFGTPERKGLWG